MNQNIVIFDWFSLTDKISSPNDIIEMLGLADVPFQDLPGVMGIQGFEKRLYFSGISIHYKGKNDYIWLEMSGQGCRTFESLGNGDYKRLFNYCLSYPDDVNITRLDVAYDDYYGYLDMKSIVKDTLNGNYISRSRKYEVTLSDSGSCVVHGKRRSEILIRIYDKAAERNRSDEIEHWVRCEIQLRRQRAFEFVRLFMVENETIEHLYFLVLNNYLRFIEPCGTDTNKWRAPVAKHWLQFSKFVDEPPVSLFTKPGMDYNTMKLSHYVTDMSGGAIFTYIKLYGINKLFDEVKKHQPKLNPKYRLLLAEAEEFEKLGVSCEYNASI